MTAAPQRRAKSAPASPPLVRQRRARCYWEAIYKPELVGKLKNGTWDFSNQRGPTHLFFQASELQKSLIGKRTHIIEGVTFTECDFQGLFEFDVQFVFQKCTFVGCDLSLTTWTNVKFSKCDFQRSSIGQCIFRRCEFRDCSWKEISFSSNETEFYDTIVSNPKKLVSAGYTNVDDAVLAKFNSKKQYQLMRLETNKATIARSLMNNLRAAGDDDTFYQSVATFENQQAKGRYRRARYYSANGDLFGRVLSFLQMMFWFSEWGLLNIFGTINGWGATSLRPLLGLALTLASFTAIYRYVFPEIENPFLMSFDISAIAGYSKYALEAPDPLLQFAQSMNLCLSLIFYSVFFATLVAKLSRVR